MATRQQSSMSNEMSVLRERVAYVETISGDLRDVKSKLDDVLRSVQDVAREQASMKQAHVELAKASERAFMELQRLETDCRGEIAKVDTQAKESLRSQGSRIEEIGSKVAQIWWLGVGGFAAGAALLGLVQFFAAERYNDFRRDNTTVADQVRKIEDRINRAEAVAEDRATRRR